MDFKKSLTTTFILIAAVFAIAALVGSIRNSEKIGFFTSADQLKIYDISPETAADLSEEELTKTMVYYTNNINSVFKNITPEETAVDTEGAYYARLYTRDGDVMELIFLDYAHAFLKLGDEAVIYRYGLKNRDKLLEERQD